MGGKGGQKHGNALHCLNQRDLPRPQLQAPLPYNPSRGPDLKTATADTVAFLPPNSHLPFLPSLTPTRGWTLHFSYYV